MKIYFRNIIFSFIAVLLVGLITLPSVLKLKHAIFEHHTFVCKEKGKLHIHEVELDCDYHKFNLTHYYTHFQQEIATFTVITRSAKIIDFYSFLSKHQKLHFSRRGPPTAA
ncbi:MULTISPECIES: hypothetical protein [unclassified Arenibacter]|uniref:hypothetical protein n=1 Tax=unclassified Arenibacter TaxID=2615047 RepID=UPI000E3561A4|nr:MULTISPECIES: hypothetical protein [unclassified Arenibacter]MCM4163096.1 hypothetical protein [Arenibacter sp. A80]RFT57128.1 hypothetical protein D0S24_05760 [Arenibacter sp. P308M17]